MSQEVDTIAENTSDQSDDYREQIAIRLGALDLTRCTEQTSILASLLMGHGIGGHDTEDRGMYRPTVGRLVLRTMLGYLADAYFNISFAELQDSDPFYCKTDYVRQIWKPFNQLLAQREAPELQLELLTIPVDGLGDLLRGYTGAVSFIAGGKPGSFCNVFERDSEGRIVKDEKGRPKSLLASEYLTVCVSAEIANSIENAADVFDPNSCLAGESDQLTPDVVSVVKQLVHHAWKHSNKRQEQFTVATMESKETSPFRRPLGVKWRLRTFSGSPVAGATSACLGTLGIDTFAAILKPIEVAIVSASAMATGGRVFHIPVEWIEHKEVERNTWHPVKPEEKVDKKKHKTKKIAHVVGTAFGDASTFVAKNKDLFVIATGVGESILLDGVRYPGEHTASTHTLCICSHTQSTRFLVLNHNLKRRKYVVLNEECDRADWLDYKRLSTIVTDMFSDGTAED